MQPSIYERGFLYTQAFMAIKQKKENVPRGLACLQKDDTVYVGNDLFMELEVTLKTRVE